MVISFSDNEADQLRKSPLDGGMIVGLGWIELLCLDQFFRKRHLVRLDPINPFRRRARLRRTRCAFALRRVAAPDALGSCAPLGRAATLVPVSDFMRCVFPQARVRAPKEWSAQTRPGGMGSAPTRSTPRLFNRDFYSNSSQPSDGCNGTLPKLRVAGLFVAGWAAWHCRLSRVCRGNAGIESRPEALIRTRRISSRRLWFRPLSDPSHILGLQNRLAVFDETIPVTACGWLLIF